MQSLTWSRATLRDWWSVHLLVCAFEACRLPDSFSAFCFSWTWTEMGPRTGGKNISLYFPNSEHVRKKSRDPYRSHDSQQRHKQHTRYKKFKKVVRKSKFRVLVFMYFFIFSFRAARNKSTTATSQFIPHELLFHQWLADGSPACVTDAELIEFSMSG